MHAYTAAQWVLLFFFHCLCGWIWESCYVSARQRRWVNRGFLHGPLLPIYGSGAIIILFATLPVEGNLLLVYVFGAAAATALEYVTGAAMEALFKVRYWDYSNQKLNLHGYICATSTLAWGAFSILLVQVVHPPIGRLVVSFAAPWANGLAFALTAGFAVDAVQSFRAALDLREILTRLTEENEDLRRLAKRAEVISAFAEEDLRCFRERTEIEKLLLSDRIEAGRERAQEARQARTLRRREALEEAQSRLARIKMQALEGVSAALEDYRDRMMESKELTGAALEERMGEVGEALAKLRELEERVRQRTAGTYVRSMRILRGNPSASAAARYAEAMESLRHLGEKKK